VCARGGARCRQRGTDLGRAWTTTIRTIAHLNDYHKWTREQIADWVETMEPVAAAAAPAERDSGDLASVAGVRPPGVTRELLEQESL
jgi:hypothetical protein